MALGAAFVALAALLLLTHAMMEDGCGSGRIGGMETSLPMVGHGGDPTRVHGVPTLDVEEFILQDNEFREQHIVNMAVRG